MIIKIPDNVRIVIVEGIAGSGKSTLVRHLKKHLKYKNLLEFDEQEQLLSWKHIHVPGVSRLRIEYVNLFLNYIEEKLKSEPDTLFIFERFHLSIRVLEWEFENDFNDRYKEIVERLRSLPVHILIAKLDPKEIQERMLHRERSAQWDRFIDEKLQLRGFPDLETLSVAQQTAFFEAAAEQKIPFTPVHVELEEYQLEGLALNNPSKNQSTPV